MENNDKPNRLMIELFGWAKWNLFLGGVFFFTGWAIGIYKLDVISYSTASADEVLSWELAQEMTPKTSKK